MTTATKCKTCQVELADTYRSYPGYCMDCVDGLAQLTDEQLQTHCNDLAEKIAYAEETILQTKRNWAKHRARLQLAKQACTVRRL